MAPGLSGVASEKVVQPRGSHVNTMRSRSLGVFDHGGRDNSQGRPVGSTRLGSPSLATCLLECLVATKRNWLAVDTQLFYLKMLESSKTEGT